VWDTRQVKCLRELRGHTATVSCLATLQDGELIASGGFDDTIRLWKLVDGVRWDQKKHGKPDASEAQWELDHAPQFVNESIEVLKRDEAAGKDGHTSPLRCLHITKLRSTGEEVMLSGADDRTVRMWRISPPPAGEGSRCIRVFPCYGPGSSPVAIAALPLAQHTREYAIVVALRNGNGKHQLKLQEFHRRWARSAKLQQREDRKKKRVADAATAATELVAAKDALAKLKKEGDEEQKKKEEEEKKEKDITEEAKEKEKESGGAAAAEDVTAGADAAATSAAAPDASVSSAGAAAAAAAAGPADDAVAVADAVAAAAAADATPAAAATTIVGATPPVAAANATVAVVGATPPPGVAIVPSAPGAPAVAAAVVPVVVVPLKPYAERLAEAEKLVETMVKKARDTKVEAETEEEAVKTDVVEGSDAKPHAFLVMESGRDCCPHLGLKMFVDGEGHEPSDEAAMKAMTEPLAAGLKWDQNMEQVARQAEKVAARDADRKRKTQMQLDRQRRHEEDTSRRKRKQIEKELDNRIVQLQKSEKHHIALVRLSACGAAPLCVFVCQRD